MIAFVFGLGLMALTIGFISGLSSSPVVAVLLPLLFALATAGGNLYVVFGKEATAERDSESRKDRAIFIGSQLSIFSIFFLSGLWLGVKIKIDPSLLWKTSTATSLYSDYVSQDPEFTIILRSFDIMFAADGINEEERNVLLAAIFEQRESFKSAPKVVESPGNEPTSVYEFIVPRQMVTPKLPAEILQRHPMPAPQISPLNIPRNLQTQ